MTQTVHIVLSENLDDDLDCHFSVDFVESDQGQVDPLSGPVRARVDQWNHHHSVFGSTLKSKNIQIHLNLPYIKMLFTSTYQIHLVDGEISLGL